MITKERLQELIYKNATVYDVNCYTEGIYLTKDNFEATDKELVFKYKIYAVLLEDLFETKEDAEWYREFGCIERIERLELPTWKEINEIIKEKKWFCLEFKTKFEEISFVVDEYKISVIHHHKEYMSGSDETFNKENYLKSCRECVALFRGEL